MTHEMPVTATAAPDEGGERESSRRRHRGGRDRTQAAAEALLPSPAQASDSVDQEGNSAPNLDSPAGAAVAAVDAQAQATGLAAGPADQAEREGSSRRRGRGRGRGGERKHADASQADEAHTDAGQATSELESPAESEPAPQPALALQPPSAVDTRAPAFEPAGTPADDTTAEAPATTAAAPQASEPYELPLAALQNLAGSAGLEWVHSDADKMRAVRLALASEAPPVRVPRVPRQPVVVDDGPLVLVETRKDLAQIELPFDSAASRS